MTDHSSSALRFPGAERVRDRLDRALRTRVEAAVGPLQKRLQAQDRRIAALERAAARRQGLGRQVNVLQNHFERLQVQMASLEQRLEDLRTLVSDPLEPGTSQERAEARELIDEIRREHQQIRSRMTAISWYEDRLRKLEEAQPRRC